MLFLDIVGELRKVVIIILVYLFKLLAGIYDVFDTLIRINIFTGARQNIVVDIYKRVQAILYVVMVFYLIFQFIKYIIQPDVSNDAEKGVGGTVKKLVVVVLLMAFTPSLFNFAYILKEKILDSNLISNVILGTNETTFEVSESNELCKPEHDGECTNGGVFAANVFDLFVTIEQECATTNLKSDYSPSARLLHIKKYISGAFGKPLKLGWKFDDGCEKGGTEYWFFNIDGLAGFAVALFMIWIFVNYCVEAARLVFQFAFLQLVAPIPIMSYLSSNKDGMFNKWKNLCFTTYLDSFIRFAIISFVLLLIKILMDLYSTGFVGIISDKVGDGVKIFVIIFLIVGLLFFALKAPDLLKQLLPQGLSSNANFGFGKKGSAFRALGAGLGATSAAAKGLAGLARQGARGVGKVKDKMAKGAKTLKNAHRLKKYGGLGYAQQIKIANDQRKIRRDDAKKEKKQLKADAKQAKKDAKEKYKDRSAAQEAAEELKNSTDKLKNDLKNKRELKNKEKDVNDKKENFDKAKGKHRENVDAYKNALDRKKELEGKAGGRTADEEAELSALNTKIPELKNKMKASHEASMGAKAEYENARADFSKFAKDKFGKDEKGRDTGIGGQVQKADEAISKLKEARQKEAAIAADPTKTDKEKADAKAEVNRLQREARAAIAERDGENMKNYLSAQDEYNAIKNDPNKSPAEKLAAVERFNEARNMLGLAYSSRENEKTLKSTLSGINSTMQSVNSAAILAGTEYNNAKNASQVAIHDYDVAVNTHKNAVNNYEAAKLEYNAAARNEEVLRKQLETIKSDPTNSKDAIDVVQKSHDEAVRKLSDANTNLNNAKSNVTAAEANMKTSKSNMDAKNEDMNNKKNAMDKANQQNRDYASAVNKSDSLFSSYVSAQSEYERLRSLPDTPENRARLTEAEKNYNNARQAYNLSNVNESRQNASTIKKDSLAQSVMSKVDDRVNTSNMTSVSSLAESISTSMDEQKRVYKEAKKQVRETSEIYQTAKKVGSTVLKGAKVIDQVAGEAVGVAGTLFGTAKDVVKNTLDGVKIEEYDKLKEYHKKLQKERIDSRIKEEEYLSSGGKTTFSHRVSNVLTNITGGLGVYDPIQRLSIMNKRLELPIEQNNASSTNLSRIISTTDSVKNVTKSLRESGKLHNDISVDLNGVTLKNGRTINVAAGTTANDLFLSVSRDTANAKSNSEVRLKAANEHKKDMALSVQNLYSSFEQSLLPTYGDNKASKEYHDGMVNIINSNTSLSASEKAVLLEQADLDYASYSAEKAAQDAAAHQGMVEKAIDEATMTKAIRLVASGGGIKVLADNGIDQDIYNQITAMFSSIQMACSDKGTAERVASTLISEFSKTPSDNEVRLVSKPTINTSDFVTVNWSQLKDLVSAVGQAKNSYDTDNEQLKEIQRQNNQKISNHKRDKEYLGGGTESGGSNK